MLIGKLLVIVLAVAAVFYVIHLAGGPMVMGDARVVDGDTLVVDGKRIRLAGIDAVELHQACTFAGKDWPCGKRAALVLENYIGGTKVTCRPTGDKSYDRVVAKCFKGVSDDLGKFMVQQGWAVAEPEFTKDYVDDEAAARAQLRGIWASLFLPPRQYRAQQRLAQQIDSAH